MFHSNLLVFEIVFMEVHIILGHDSLQLQLRCHYERLPLPAALVCTPELEKEELLFVKTLKSAKSYRVRRGAASE
jgi:hypothetical protein